MLRVCGSVLAIHKDIVKEDDDVSTKVGAKNMVHRGLEDRRRIREPERHDEEFEVAIVSTESGFMDVVRMDTDLVVTRTKVKLRENLSGPQFVKELINSGNRESVLDRYSIQGAIIHTKPP